MTDDKDRVVRDPIYGYIDLFDREPAVIDSKVFQRLRGIKQLANTYLVYPSAIHTRFTHSLGTMHVAGLMAARLQMPRPKQRLVRLAALLHDVGHGPFSHLFEDLCKAACDKKLKHEEVGDALIRTDPELHKALGNDGPQVRRILAGGGGLASKIISGGLDADKMDYFKRDSFHAGVRYGEYDIERILRTITPKGQNFYIPQKGVDAVDGFLLAREQLHTQVYNHHTRLIADMMLQRVVELAAKHEQGRIKKEWFRFDPRRPRRFLDRFESWDDHTFLDMLDDNVEGPARDLLERIQSRRLFKDGYNRSMQRMPEIPRGQLIDPDTGSDTLRRLERHISRELHLQTYQVFAHVIKIDMKQYYLSEGEKLLAEDEDGVIRNFLDISKLRGPSTDLLRLLVFGPAGTEERVGQETEAFIRSLDQGA